MNAKNIVISSVILFVFWVLLNNSIALINLLIGAGLSLMLSFLFCRSCNVFGDVKLTPGAFFYTIVYLFVFVGELIKSNLDVARRVVSPALPIKPGIVEVKTSLQSPMARMILANSITLTPGTLTVDMQDDQLFIHWIEVKTADQQQATEQIVHKFEKYLEKIYG
ncbi:Mrp complex subunit E1 [Salinivirga cyanobacteriivorans]|uniref:Mrp complex subunit E1 n=1 Tax=Salinivirga cyanobacteriivorans TaxID=1307839 RepID=A0A0S2I1P2_9BACT|nr:Na+/H+ antiporter subunit E [Salinivirga cyanobacteriivorans]ALO16323.1 Mrp complex subunit E1 [Salinivirga cyanobacteriivorans]